MQTMRVKLVEITREPSWKASWYRKGERHLAVVDPDYPMLTGCRYRAVLGGIMAQDCREVDGVRSWLRRAAETVKRLG